MLIFSLKMRLSYQSLFRLFWPIINMRFWFKKVPQGLKIKHYVYFFGQLIKTDFDPKRCHKCSRAPPLQKSTFFFSKHGYKSKYFVDFFGRLSIVTLLPKGASNAQAPYPEIWVCSLKTCLKYQALFWFFWPRTNRYLDVKRWNKGSRTPTPQFSEVDFSPSKRPKNIQRFSIFLVDNQQWFWS